MYHNAIMLLVCFGLSSVGTSCSLQLVRIFGLGNACYHSVQSLLSSRLLSKNLKTKIYRTIILPVLTSFVLVLNPHYNYWWSYSRWPESSTFIKLWINNLWTSCRWKYFVPNSFILYVHEKPMLGVIYMVAMFYPLQRGRFLSEHPSQYGPTQ